MSVSVLRGATIKEALSEPYRLAAVKRELDADDPLSRTKLAAALCRRFRFRDQNGGLQVFSCLKALRDLEKEGSLRLPPRQLEIVSHWRPRRLAEAVPEPKEVPNSVEDVLGLRLVMVDPDDDTAMRTWNELIRGTRPAGRSGGRAGIGGEGRRGGRGS